MNFCDGCRNGRIDFCFFFCFQLFGRRKDVKNKAFFLLGGGG